MWLLNSKFFMAVSQSAWPGIFILVKCFYENRTIDLLKQMILDIAWVLYTGNIK